MASTVQADTITNAAGTGAPTFSNGLISSAATTIGSSSGSFAGNAIYGRKDGSGVGAGLIGEVVENISSTTIVALSTNIANGGVGFGSAAQTNYYIIYKTTGTGDAAVPLALTAGVWRIEAGIRWTDSTVGQQSELQFRLYNSASAADAVNASAALTHVMRPHSTGNPPGNTALMSGYVTLSSPTTYYLYILFVGTGLSTFQIVNCWTRGIRIG